MADEQDRQMEEPNVPEEGQHMSTQDEQFVREDEQQGCEEEEQVIGTESQQLATEERSFLSAEGYQLLAPEQRSLHTAEGHPLQPPEQEQLPIAEEQQSEKDQRLTTVEIKEMLVAHVEEVVAGCSEEVTRKNTEDKEQPRSQGEAHSRRVSFNEEVDALSDQIVHPERPVPVPSWEGLELRSILKCTPSEEQVKEQEMVVVQPAPELAIILIEEEDLDDLEDDMPPPMGGDSPSQGSRRG